MKRVFILILVIGILATPAIAQSIDSCNIQIARQDMNNLTNSVIDALYSAGLNIIAMIHWELFLILIFCASVFNESVEADNWAPWMSSLKKITRGLRTFIMGALFVIAISWTYRIKDRIQISEMILTIFFAMGSLSIGINKGVRILAQWLGLKFGK